MAGRLQPRLPYDRDFTDCYRVRGWAEFETLMDDLLQRRKLGLPLEHMGP